MLHGMELAWKCGVRNLIAESDSAVIVSLLKTQGDGF